ncbi:MAG: MBL fold metallo-hydrolase [Clostridiaceae bacterium]|nr:MBL fold metallo-hydrolase [Clostridiaceae bacterium]
MGAEVSWDQNTQTATAVKDSIKVVLKIGSVSPTINGQIVNLDVPAKIVNGRTLAPLRFVGEAFGGTVEWNQASQLISITSVPTSGTPPPKQEIKVHFIDVGQADSIYIQLPENKDILIDGGNVSDGSLVVNYLKKQNVDDIELLIATHPHEDHIGGLPDVLDAFIIEQILDSGYAATTNIYKEYSSKAQAEGCTWISDNYQTYTWGATSLQILTGDQSWGSNANNYSVVCRLDTGDIEFLFTGDAEAAVEDIFTGTLEAEILKVGHHGSTSSSSLAFLNKVDPEVAVICVGTGNTYGHPHQETLNKLQNKSIKIYRTDLNGTIVVTTDGKTFSLSTQKNLPTPVAPVITPVPSNPAPTPSIGTGKYVGSIKSDKYHLPSCRYAQSIAPENQIWFDTEEEALAAGYTPCGVCKP